ncbi:MAG: DUF2779 domain-containing protein [Erysipelotrichia bacterium]|nr:DUF2779 domain-containing protein [Erysipelotrichia bacterium]
MHVSDVKKFLRCKKLYKLATEDENSKPFPFMNINIDISESIKRKLDIKDTLSGEVNETAADSFEKMNKCAWIFKARFEYNDLRVKIPLFHLIADNICDIYFINCSIYINDDMGIDMSLCQYVLSNCGLQIRNIYLLYLNKDYIREKNLDDKKLWILTDSFSKNGNGKKIKDIVNKYSYDWNDLLQQMKDYHDEDFPNKQPGCSGRKRCSYYEKCFPDKVIKEDNSILTLVSGRYKEKMYDNGIRYLKDADIDLIEGNRVQYAQIMADKADGLFVDKLALKDWLSRFEFPLSFIDFEWDLFPIPPYEMMKPMDVLLFQYSLHVYDGNELKHYEFIGEHDDRLPLLESLLQAIPQTGTILAYNANGAEKLRLKELSEYFPQYREQIEDITKRIVDMALPFINGVVYDVRMRGNFTLKTLENMIDKEHSYNNLEVGNGVQAVEIHRLMEKSDDKEKLNYYKQLYEYCGLDSYSLYELYQWLNKILSH